MQTKSKPMLAAALIAAVLLCAAGACQAQSWPTKPIRFVVGFPPGGPTDVVGRIIGERLGDNTGQQVVIDNRPGAAGNIGAELVAKATPDGYTMLYASNAIALSPGLYSKLGFDPVKDLAPVTEIGSGSLVFVAHPSLPVTSVKEFIDYARARPGQLNYASSGAGTSTHLAAVLFEQRTGIKAQHVPYKGTAPSLVDMIAGRTQFLMGAINTAVPHIKDGRLRALAVTGLKRTPSLPDVPTLDQSGITGFEVTSWQGVFAPAATPAPVLARIHAELIRIVRNPDMKPKLEQQDMEPTGPAADAFGKAYRAELARWTKLAKDVGLKAD